MTDYKTPPILCDSEAEFRDKWRVYVRDMSLQGIAVTASRRGNTITCKETGKSWTILSDKWDQFDKER